MRTIVHVTHEAIRKVGGIGAVLQGLITSKAYRNRDQRTILIGPLFDYEGSGVGRLGPSGDVLYSSVDGIAQSPVSKGLDNVCSDFNVDIVYGHRTFTDPHNGVCTAPETALIDVSLIDQDKVNSFKAKLWRAFRLDSSRYEQSPDYDLYVKLAQPALAVLHVLGAADYGDECVILAHEYMGMPTALATMVHPNNVFRTVFYAHEVSSMRRIVEQHPGHDLAFYNILPLAIEKGRYVNDVFGPQSDYYRHELVRASQYCDKIFAVGDHIVDELHFLGSEFENESIDITYNGIPAEQISLEQKRISQGRLRDYAQILLGYRPDYTFTHVTRTAVSKGLWRDIRVLEHMEQVFRERNKSAVLFVLSTEIGMRSPEHVREMEWWWKWPVAHREISPDLSAGEALFYQGVQEFNARSRQIKIVFVNQFGWDQTVCGDRMPEEMEFMDIRRGSDVEFGQSIYEPFGISQLEPLTFGGICVLSDACGCAGFLKKVTGGKHSPNVIIADYCDLGKHILDELALLRIDRDSRDRHEIRGAKRVADQLLDMLPTDDASTEALIVGGYELAKKMSWEVVASEYVLPGIDSVCSQPRRAEVA